MLESVITSVVNNFLGRYVDGFDKDQLRIRLLAGEFKLQQLKLKGDAFAQWHLPLEIEFGEIGLLHIEWDWTALTSKPVIVTLSDVSILLKEKSQLDAQQEIDAAASDSDETKKLNNTESQVHEAAIQAKLSKLKEVEDFRLSTDTETHQPGFITKLIQGVVSNLKVIVKNIHLRYEHRSKGDVPTPFETECTHPCAIGFTMRELILANSNSRWERVDAVDTQQQEDRTAFKLLQILGVGIYCQTHPSGLAETTTPESMMSLFHPSVSIPTAADSSSAPIHRHARIDEFLLVPFDCSVRAILHKVGESEANRGPDEPLLKLKLILPSLQVRLSQPQFHSMIQVLSNFSNVQRRMAVFSGGFNQPFERIGTFEEKERYIELYKRTLSSSWQMPLTPFEITETHSMERDIIYDCLNEWRLCALAELQLEMPPEIGDETPLTKRQDLSGRGIISQVKQHLSSVTQSAFEMGKSLSSTFGLSGGEKNEEEGEEEKSNYPSDSDNLLSGEPMAREPKVKLTDDERAKVRAEALSSSEVIFLPTGGKGREALKVLVEVAVESVQIALLSSAAERKMLYRLVLHKVHVYMWQRIDSLKLELSLHHLAVEDDATQGTAYDKVLYARPHKPDTVKPSFKDVVSASTTPLSSTSPHFLHLKFESNPLDESCDSKVWLRMKPIELVVHPLLIATLAQFFSVPNDIDMEALTDIKVASLDELLKISADDAKRTLADHKSTQLDIQVDGATIFVVSDPCTHTTLASSPSLLVLDVPQITISSVNQSKESLKLLQAMMDEYAGKVHPSRQNLEQLVTEDAESANQFYDSINIQLQSVACFLTPSMTSYQTVWSNDKPRSHLLTPFNLTIKVDQSIAPNLTFLPAQRVSIPIPAIRLQVSRDILSTLLSKSFISPWMELLETLKKSKEIESNQQGPEALSNSRKEMEEKRSELSKPSELLPAEALNIPGVTEPSLSNSERQSLEQKFEANAAVESVQANPPTGPALSTRDALDAAGFSAGSSSSIHALDGAIPRFQTFHELVVALQSEKIARKIFAEKANPIDAPEFNDQVTQEEFERWYDERKRIIKNNINSQLDISLQSIQVCLMDKAPALAELDESFTPLPASSSSSHLGNETSKLSPLLQLEISAVHVFQQQKSFDSLLVVEVGGLALNEFLTGEKNLTDVAAVNQHPASQSLPIIQTLQMKKSIKPAPMPGRQVSASSVPFCFLTLATLSPESPDFQSHPYSSEIDIALGELQLNVDPSQLNQVGKWLLQQFLTRDIRDQLRALAPADKKSTEEKEEANEAGAKEDLENLRNMPPPPQPNVESVNRNFSGLADGQRSVVNMQVRLVWSGITLRLLSEGQRFATLSVLDVTSTVVQRINQLEVTADVDQLWLLDELIPKHDSINCLNRSIIWISQSTNEFGPAERIPVLTQPTGLGDIPLKAPTSQPFIHIMFKQHDLAKQQKTGFLSSMSAALIGLRMRFATTFVIHALTFAQRYQDLELIKIVQDEIEYESQQSGGKAPEEFDSDADDTGYHAGPAPPVSGLKKLKRQRVARLKEKKVNWFWSTDIPAPLQLDVALDDWQIELPLPQLDHFPAIISSAYFNGEAAQSAAASATAVNNESLILHIDGIYANNYFKDADKIGDNASTSTVRFEHFDINLGSIALHSTFSCAPGEMSTALLEIADTTLEVNKFSHGNLLDARFELGNVQCTLPQEQYVFLMRLMFALQQVGDKLQSLASNGPGKSNIQSAIEAKQAQSRQHLYRGADGSLETKPLTRIDETEDESSSSDEAEESIQTSDSMRKLPSLKVKFIVSRVCVELMKGRGWNKANDGLLKFLLKDLKMHSSFDHESGVIAADASISVLRLIDMSSTMSAPDANSTLIEERKTILPAYRNILHFGQAIALDQEILKKPRVKRDLKKSNSVQEPAQDAPDGATATSARTPSSSTWSSIILKGAPSATDENPSNVKLATTSAQESVQRQWQFHNEPNGSSIKAPAALAAPVLAQPKSASPESSTPLLLLRVQRLGYDSSHALEVDAEMNDLQLLVSPSIMAIPDYFKLPGDLQKRMDNFAKKKVDASIEDKKAEMAESLEKVSIQGSDSLPTIGAIAARTDEEKQAIAVSADQSLMADSLITSAASTEKSKDKQPASTDAPAPPTPIYVRFRMNDPYVLLVADPTSNNTRGLVMNWGIDVAASVTSSFDDVHTQLSLTNFSLIESTFVVPSAESTVLVFNKRLEEGTRPIISPFYIKISLQRLPSALFQDRSATQKTAHALSCDVQASRIDFNFGFRFYQLLNQTFNQLLTKSNESELESLESNDRKNNKEDPNDKIEKSIEEHLNVDQNEFQESETEVIEAQDPLATFTNGQPVPALNFNEINLSVNIVGIYVNGINDSWLTSLPFFRVQLENIYAAAHRFGDSGGLTGSFELRSEAFNHRLLSWEPVIEPWKANVSVHQCQMTHTPAAALLVASTEQMAKAHLQNDNIKNQPVAPFSALLNPLAPITSLSFTSTTKLNFNLSAALLEDLADTWNTIESEMKAPGDRWKQVIIAPNYKLCNHTDLALQVYRSDLSQLDDSSTQPTEVMNVLPFSNAVFDFSETVAVVSRALRVQLISPHGTLPMLSIPLANEKSTKHVLRPADESTALTLLVDVGWENGVRVLSLHSAWAVSNQTDRNILVSGDRYMQKQLAPGELMWLPLLPAPIMHTIRVKPVSLSTSRASLRDEADDLIVDEEYHWSDEIVLSSAQRPVAKKDDGDSPAMLEYYSCTPTKTEVKESDSMVVHPSTSSFSQLSNDSIASAAPTSSAPRTTLQTRTSMNNSFAGAFNFSCFHGGVDTIQLSDEMKDGIEVPKTREFHASIFEIRTPLTIENVLATDVNIRILRLKADEKHSKDVSIEQMDLVQDMTLARGASHPTYTTSFRDSIYLSFQFPHLACNWSKPMLLDLNKKKGSTTEVLMATVYGANGGQLPLCLEVRPRHGNIHVALYVQYWLWDLSSLGLQISADKKTFLPSRISKHRKSSNGNGNNKKNREAHLESISLPDKHEAIMFNFNNTNTSKDRVLIRAGRHSRSNGFELNGPCDDFADTSIQWSEWSEEFSMDAVNNQSALSLPMGKAKSAGSYELIADIQAGEGKFHRTKMVKFLPRYILLNLLPQPVLVKQYNINDQTRLTLNRNQQVIWHWPHAVHKDRRWISVRRIFEAEASAAASSSTALVESKEDIEARSTDLTADDSTQGWNWSGYYNLNQLGDQMLMIPNAKNNGVWYLHVEVRERNGMNFIMLHEYSVGPLSLNPLKMRFPYCISNRSKFMWARVRQFIGDKESKDYFGKDEIKKEASDEFQWFIIEPQKELPFNFQQPLLNPQLLHVEFGYPNYSYAPTTASSLTASGSTQAPTRSFTWFGEKDSKLSKFDLEDFDDEHAYLDFNRPAGWSSASSITLQSPTQQAGKGRLYYFKEQDGPTCFFVLSDEASEKWKKQRMREMKEERIKARDENRSKLLTDGGNVEVATDSTTLPADANALSSASKQTVEERKEADNDATLPESTIGVRTTEQTAIPTSQSVAEEQMLKTGDDVVAQTPITAASQAIGGKLPQGLNSSLGFHLNARNFRDKISQLRVKLHSVQLMRESDKRKDVYTRVELGDRKREIDLPKGGLNATVGPESKVDETQQDESDKSEVVFSGDEIGQSQLEQKRQEILTQQLHTDRLSTILPHKTTLPMILPTSSQSQISQRLSPLVYTARLPYLYSPTATDLQRGKSKPQQSLCSCFMTTVTTHDNLHVFVDVYSRSTLLSDKLIGSVSVNLRSITEDSLPRWYELRKKKKNNMETRGRIQLSIWYLLKPGVTSLVRPQNSLDTLIRAYPNVNRISDESQYASSKKVLVYEMEKKMLSTDEKKDELMPAEPRGELLITTDAPPEQASNATFVYSNAAVYASSLKTLPPIQPLPPHFSPLGSTQTDAERNIEAEERERLAMEMMEAEAVRESSWSEYTVRILDTMNLDRVASSLMLDLNTGRIVCYVTAPFFRRGYSVLVHDRTHTGLVNVWNNQEIVFAVPDELAAERKKDAILRFSFYFYPQAAANIQTYASLHEMHRVASAQASASMAASTNEPVLLGTTVIPLLSIQTVKMDSESQRAEIEPQSQGMDEETSNSVVDVAGTTAETTASTNRSSISTGAVYSESDAHKNHPLRKKDWTSKWLAIATPAQSTEFAQVCLKVQRKEVKMPTEQAVMDADKLASYTPSRVRVRMKLPWIGISFIDGQPEEVAFFTIENLSLQLRDSATQTIVRLSIDKIQLDDLLNDAMFPVLLNASSVGVNEWMPVVQFAMCKSKHPSEVGMQCFPYISTLIQSLDVKISELYIYKVLDFIRDLQKRMDQQQQDSSNANQQRLAGLPPSESIIQNELEQEEDRVLIYRRMSDEFVLPTTEPLAIYTKFLHLQPIEINLTFAANPGIRNKFMGERFNGGGMFGKLLRNVVTVIGAGIGGIDQAPIRISGLILQQRVGSVDSYSEIFAKHFIKEGIKQIYAVVGSLEILGKPVATASELSTGVTEFFYAPVKGLMVSPEAFGEGLAEGSISLVKHSISGLGNAVSGVFSSGGKAMAALSMDNEFITDSSQRNATQPQHAGQGLRLGMVSLAHGFKEGVTGIYTQPMKGAREEGTAGFFKGLGKGILGLAAKPTAGVLNAVSQTAKGVANTGSYLTEGPKMRIQQVRTKRFIDPVERRVEVYDEAKSRLAIEQEKLSAGDLKKRSIRRKEQVNASEQDNAEALEDNVKFEQPTQILHHQTMERQALHMQREQVNELQQIQAKEDSTDLQVGEKQHQRGLRDPVPARLANA